MYPQSGKEIVEQAFGTCRSDQCCADPVFFRLTSPCSSTPRLLPLLLAMTCPSGPAVCNGADGCVRMVTSRSWFCECRTSLFNKADQKSTKTVSAYCFDSCLWKGPAMPLVFVSPLSVRLADLSGPSWWPKPVTLSWTRHDDVGPAGRR